MIKKLLLCITIVTLFTENINAQWALGDIAFSAYSADNTVPNGGPIDAFTIVLLRNVSSGEDISFTENGWLAAGGFRSGENTCTLLFTSNYLEGTQIIISRDPFEARDQNGSVAGTLTGAGLSFATSGDQIFAFEPSNSNESGLIAGIHMNGDWDADASSSTTSAKPSVFADGINSISISPEVDNARVSMANCSNFSDITTLRTMLNTASSWETDNTNAYDQSTPVCNFLQTLSAENLKILENAISVFPNPVNDRFRINVTNNIVIDKVEVYDITGQRVITIDNYNANSTINLSSLETGIYLSKIFSNGKSIVKKLIKQ